MLTIALPAQPKEERAGRRSGNQTSSKIMSNSPEFASLDDAIAQAKRKLPGLIFDFIEGAAGLETAATENKTAFAEIKLQPRILQEVSKRSLDKKILGQTYALPFGVSPMGMCNLIHPDADKLIARASAVRDIPVCLSTAGSTSIEKFATLAGASAAKNAWFQLYVQSHEQAMDMVERAEKSDYETLMLTLDMPQISRRVRDIRNGFEVPFRIGPGQFLDFAMHPAWSINRLMNGVPGPVNFELSGDGKPFDRSAQRTGSDIGFLRKLRERWKGNLIIKGVMCTEDALLVQKEGVDGILVSNHGGRQLDASPPAISVLSHIRAAVGPDFPILFDSGIRSGEDVVKALALGADFVMLGRPILFALGANGSRGLDSLFDIFRADIDTILAQIGCANVENLNQNVLVKTAAK